MLELPTYDLGLTEIGKSLSKSLNDLFSITEEVRDLIGNKETPSTDKIICKVCQLHPKTILQTELSFLSVITGKQVSHISEVDIDPDMILYLVRYYTSSISNLKTSITLCSRISSFYYKMYHRVSNSSVENYMIDVLDDLYYDNQEHDFEEFIYSLANILIWNIHPEKFEYLIKTDSDYKDCTEEDMDNIDSFMEDISCEIGTFQTFFIEY